MTNTEIYRVAKTMLGYVPPTPLLSRLNRVATLLAEVDNHLNSTQVIAIIIMQYEVEMNA